jgi:hypothetical protein
MGGGNGDRDEGGEVIELTRLESKHGVEEGAIRLELIRCFAMRNAQSHVHGDATVM